MLSLSQLWVWTSPVKTASFNKSEFKIQKKNSNGSLTAPKSNLNKLHHPQIHQRHKFTQIGSTMKIPQNRIFFSPNVVKFTHVTFISSGIINFFSVNRLCYFWSHFQGFKLIWIVDFLWFPFAGVAAAILPCIPSTSFKI